jgi:excisionase family DNA binding protein
MQGLNSKEMLTLKEARELLKVSRNTMYNLIQQGSIPARKVGSSWRIVRHKLEVWMNQQDNKTASLTSGSNPERDTQ